MNHESPTKIAKPTFRPTRKTPLVRSDSAPVSGGDTSTICDVSDVVTPERAARSSSRVQQDSQNSSSCSSSSVGGESKRRRIGTGTGTGMDPSCSSSDTALESNRTRTTDASFKSQVQDPHIPHSSSITAARSDSDAVSSDDCDGRDGSTVHETDQSPLMPGRCHEDGIDLTDDS